MLLPAAAAAATGQPYTFSTMTKTMMQVQLLGPTQNEVISDRGSQLLITSDGCNSQCRRRVFIFRQREIRGGGCQHKGSLFSETFYNGVVLGVKTNRAL